MRPTVWKGKIDIDMRPKVWLGKSSFSFMVGRHVQIMAGFQILRRGSVLGLPPKITPFLLLYIIVFLWLVLDWSQKISLGYMEIYQPNYIWLSFGPSLNLSPSLSLSLALFFFLVHTFSIFVKNKGKLLLIFISSSNYDKWTFSNPVWPTRAKWCGIVELYIYIYVVLNGMIPFIILIT